MNNMNPTDLTMISFNSSNLCDNQNNINTNSQKVAVLAETYDDKDGKNCATSFQSSSKLTARHCYRKQNNGRSNKITETLLDVDGNDDDEANNDHIGQSTPFQHSSKPIQRQHSQNHQGVDKNSDDTTEAIDNNEDDEYRNRLLKDRILHSHIPLAPPLPTSQQGRVSLIYKLTDTPPIHFLIFFAFQQVLLVISTPLTTTLIVAEALCANNDDVIKSQLLSATFLMMGVSTLAMVSFGVRLPVFQGPTPLFVIPLLLLKDLEGFKCPETFLQINPIDNSTSIMAKIFAQNDSAYYMPNNEIVLGRINAYGGTLMAVGSIHFLIGLTGLVSVIARLVGPITIVPIVLLFGIHIHKITVTFAETHWPTAILTAACVVLLDLYLEHKNTPLPCWTPRKGFYIAWKPIHRVFGLLLGIIVGWSACYLLTATGVLSDDSSTKEYLSRTDARIGIVSKVDWISFPYPFRFGYPSFSITALVPFLTMSIMSILDSIGDYSATAKVASVPPPPSYALNRGIAVEGFMTIISGAMGCAHGTVSFGENIGAMGVSRVASRSVFQVVGLIFVIFAFSGKLGAFFITVPYSVIGGVQIISFGMLIGVTLSFLESIDLRSQRNLSILGISVFLGMVVPFWVIQDGGTVISTGSRASDHLIQMLLSNPSFVGGFIACLLDNTVPGDLQSRGVMVKNRDVTKDIGRSCVRDTSFSPGQFYENSTHVYRLSWLPKCIRRSRLVKLFPVFCADDGEDKDGL